MPTFSNYGMILQQDSQRVGGLACVREKPPAPRRNRVGTARQRFCLRGCASRGGAQPPHRRL